MLIKAQHVSFSNCISIFCFLKQISFSFNSFLFFFIKSNQLKIAFSLSFPTIFLLNCFNSVLELKKQILFLFLFVNKPDNKFTFLFPFNRLRLIVFCSHFRFQRRSKSKSICKMTELLSESGSDLFRVQAHRAAYQMSIAEYGLLLLAVAMAIITMFLICAARSVNHHFVQRMHRLGVDLVSIDGKKTCVINPPMPAHSIPFTSIPTVAGASHPMPFVYIPR